MKKVSSLCLISSFVIAGCADFRAARVAIDEENFEDARSHYQSLRDKGFEQADYELAKLYGSGSLGDDEKWKAIEFYENAYNTGNDDAIYPLAKALMEFSDRDEDKRRAAALVSQAAENQVPGASYAYANLLLEGEWIEQDIEYAVDLYEELIFPPSIKPTETESEAAPEVEPDEQQEEFEVHAGAADRLGKLFRDGILVQRDLERAQQYFKLAYENGLQNAGLAYAKIVEQRHTEHMSTHAIPETIDSPNNISNSIPNIVNKDGSEIEPDALLDEAENILRVLSDDGILLASYRLAVLLDRRHAELPQEAAELYALSVQAGFTESKLRLADIYLRGEGVEADAEKAISIYYELSDEGNGNASARLGDVFRDGEHRPIDYQKCYEFYKLSLEQGFERAELRIAYLLAEGLGIEQDLPTAFALYQKYAELGDAGSAYQISKLIDKSEQSEAYPDNAWPWLTMAVDAEFQPAMLKMAELKIDGNSKYFNLDEGIELLKEIADSEDTEEPKAPYHLGVIYKEGSLVEQDEIAARDYLETAVELGYDQAKLKLADLYANGSDSVKNFERAKELLQDYVSEGDAEATYKLARIMEQQGGEGAITPQLVNLYRNASQQGYPPAQIRFADLLLDGNGVEQDQDNAIDTYLKLSRLEVGAATFRLGKLHEFGILRDQNDEIALEYYKQSLDEGYELGQLKIAQFLYQGRAGATDYITARNMLIKLVNDRNAKAAFILAEMYKELKFKVSNEWFKESLSWYAKAAEMGYLEAIYSQAILIEKLLKKSSPRSTLLFFQGAQKGHGKSMLEYGSRRFNGEFVPKDQTEGLTYVMASSRLQTEGALERLMLLVSQTDTTDAVDLAWAQSTELMKRLFLDTESKDSDDNKKS